jgi:hypothetical protein
LRFKVFGSQLLNEELIIRDFLNKK